MKLSSLGALFAFVAAPALVFSWDHPGHRMVSDLALASLPKDFPAFVHEPANAERIGFLAGEPDRWSHAPDLPLKHANWPEHYFDLEEIPAAGLDPAKLPALRYDFAVQFAAGRAAHPENFAAIDPEKNVDRTRQWAGFLPWTIVEHYGMLKAAFASLKVYEELGTPSEIANARADIVHVMGLMGHFVGDSAQPLHTTYHFAGWAGGNPHGYTTQRTIHTWIDSGLIVKAGIKYSDLAPRGAPAQVISLLPRTDGRDPVFVAALDFIVAQNKFVEPLYQLEKAGKLGNGPQPVSEEGRAFVEAQLLKGGTMLGTLWLTAWRGSRPDTYLRGILLKRQSAAPAPAPSTAPAGVP
ncbi:MAG TPA: hypothetical protein VHO24_04110 [Opitutaceae bacterium]|nr:hypothetical protein [Opitutaceae bacterium]